MPEKDSEIVGLLRDVNLKLNLILGEIMKSRKENIVIKDAIKHLYEFGLDSKNIAQVLGIASTHASQEISRLKKPKKEGKNASKKTAN